MEVDGCLACGVGGVAVLHEVVAWCGLYLCGVSLCGVGGGGCCDECGAVGQGDGCALVVGDGGGGECGVGGVAGVFLCYGVEKVGV